MEIQKIFALRLKEVRKLQQKTQNEVSTALGIKESSYQRYEYGMHEPKISVLSQLADYFNVSSDYLLGRTDEPTINKTKESN